MQEISVDRFFRLAPSCAVLICVLAALPGCSTLKETSVWKKTSGLYYTYVNRPIKLDLTSAEALPEGESRLASRLMSLDWQLTSLERTMEALGPVSDQNTADMLLRRFPWLSSVVILDADANVFMSVPSIQLKQLDYTPLLTVPPKSSPRDLRAFAQDTVLGPEIILARPIMQEAETVGFFAATFDFRSLLPYADATGDIVARAPGVTLWSGDRMYDETPLAGVDWDNVLNERSFGQVGEGEDAMVWIVRYLGGMPLVIAGSAN